jgi:rod shape-determining protein MreD
VIERLLGFAANRWTRFFLVALLVLGLQTTFVNEMRPYGVLVQLALAFVVAVGAVHGVELGAIAGLTVGLMYDCLLTTPLGLTSITFGFAGAVAGLLPFLQREPPWWASVLAVGGASAVGELVYPLAQAMVGLGGWTQPRAVFVAAVVGGFNLVLAPFVLPVSRWTLREATSR